MAKVSVDIPDSEINKISKDKIKDLERQLKNAENREKKLKLRVSELESNAEAVRGILNGFHDIVLEYSDQLDISAYFDYA